MKKKVETEWFVEPLDANTNEIIVRSLASLNQVYENYALSDEEGIERSVFQLDKYSFVSRLYADRRKFSLKFKVYTRRGKHSPLSPWLFDEPNRKKRSNFR